MSTSTASGPRAGSLKIRHLFGAALFSAICFAVVIFYQVQDWRLHQDLGSPTPESSRDLTDTLRVSSLIKPEGIKIIGLVFYGRKTRVEILRCYLEGNLVDHGGWLDEIHWVKNTRNVTDLDYLDNIIASSPRHKTIHLDKVGSLGYGLAWEQLERGNLYIELDDDVVWITDDAIPQVVSMKLKHPEFLLVSANMVNSPLMGWVHYHLGAIHPYLPELIDHDPDDYFDKSTPPCRTWTYSSYPAWSGPSNYTFGLDRAPPYDGHRWLRLPRDSEMHRTPVSHIEYATWGTGLKSWAIAAQEHYSFLENLANHDLGVYRMGTRTFSDHESRPWITSDKRLSINFIAIWADDVLDNLPIDAVDDEEWLTLELPKKLHREVAVNTDALAVHFSFRFQGDLQKTDLLARYRDYAFQEICTRTICDNV